VKPTKLHGLALWCLMGLVVALVVPSLVGCGPGRASEAEIIFADGTRGCKQAAEPVSFWDVPGGVPCGATIIGEIPHGGQLIILERASRFGINYYLVEHGGQRGWIPEMFTNQVAPLCE